MMDSWVPVEGFSGLGQNASLLTSSFGVRPAPWLLCLIPTGQGCGLGLDRVCEGTTIIA